MNIFTEYIICEAWKVAGIVIMWYADTVVQITRLCNVHLYVKLNCVKSGEWYVNRLFQEYRAFKCALWCAICPLLTAQKPPDDSSPPLTPSEHQHEYDFDIQRCRKVSHSRTRRYSAATVESNIRDSSLISSDIMREVLRRAFGLDRHLELYYLKLAYKFHKTKNDAQVCEIMIVFLSIISWI